MYDPFGFEQPVPTPNTCICDHSNAIRVASHVSSQMIFFLFFRGVYHHAYFQICTVFVRWLFEPEKCMNLMQSGQRSW